MEIATLLLVLTVLSCAYSKQAAFCFGFVEQNICLSAWNKDGFSECILGLSISTRYVLILTMDMMGKRLLFF